MNTQPQTSIGHSQLQPQTSIDDYLKTVPTSKLKAFLAKRRPVRRSLFKEFLVSKELQVRKDLKKRSKEVQKTLECNRLRQNVNQAPSIGKLSKSLSKLKLIR